MRIVLELFSGVEWDVAEGDGEMLDELVQAPHTFSQWRAGLRDERPVHGPGLRVIRQLGVIEQENLAHAHIVRVGQHVPQTLGGGDERRPVEAPAGNEDVAQLGPFLSFAGATALFIGDGVRERLSSLALHAEHLLTQAGGHCLLLAFDFVFGLLDHLVHLHSSVVVDLHQVGTNTNVLLDD